MKLNRLMCAGLLSAFLALAAAVAPAYADTIDYTLMDGSGDVITFALPAQPTPIAKSADWFAESTSVTIDGVAKTEDVTFYDTSFLGGLSIASTPYTDQILDQAGAQLYSGTTSAPTLLAETDVSLRCVAIGSGNPCSLDSYDEAFTLNAVDVKTPEPGSLGLLLGGMGLLGMLLATKRSGMFAALALVD